MSTEEIKNGNGSSTSTWKSRRKMAYISLFSMIGVTVILIFVPLPETRLKIISEFITWFYFGCTGITGAYMGFKAMQKMQKI